MSVEDGIRRSLRQQASAVEPSDGWDEIVRRLEDREPVTTPETTRRRTRIVVAVAAFAIFAAATVPLWLALRGHDGPSRVERLPVSAPAAPCRGGQLSARDIVTDGAAGSVSEPVALTNRSDRACMLSGYPALRFIGPGGRVLDLRAAPSPNDTAGASPSPISRAPFTLRANETAWFIVSFSDVQPPCGRVVEIAITPPGGSGTVRMRVDPIHVWSVCAGRLTVTAATPERPGG
jgi:Domain of unknown function (DUF4232)